MIGRLVGILIEKKSQGQILLDVNGVGYEIDLPLSSLAVLPEIGQIVTLLIHQVVREDALLLFGFITHIERTIFKMLIKVTGIGPKIAIIILSGLTADEFFQTIESSDSVRLSKVPGIGKKTSERLILELKDKISNLNISSNINEIQLLQPQNTLHDAVLALTGLGYKSIDAEKMIKKIATPNMAVDDLIKLALQNALK